MELIEIRGLFDRGEIDKTTFVNKMYEKHISLSKYVKFLPVSGIAKIEITDEGLFFTSRSTKYHTGGVKFFTDIRDKRVTPLEAFNFGQYEAEDSEMIYRLIKEDAVVFDIGANIGWYTTHIANILKQGKVYAFEPIPETFKALSKNIDINKLQNVVKNNIALSDKVGEIEFYFSPTVTGASSLLNITDNSDSSLVKCQMSTLDNYVKENDIEKIDFIKCDVEGGELFTFKGAVETLRLHKPVVVTEMLRKWAAKFNYHPNNIIDLFTDIGYQCYYVEEDKLTPIILVDEETAATNFVFLHKIAHADEIRKYSR